LGGRPEIAGAWYRTLKKGESGSLGATFGEKMAKGRESDKRRQANKMRKPGAPAKNDEKKDDMHLSGSREGRQNPSRNAKEK